MLFGWITRPALFGFLFWLLLSGCGANEIVQFNTNDYPEKLSDWGLIENNGTSLQIHADTLVYELNTPLFSDYSQKLRTVYIPNGRSAHYHPEEAFRFPIGSIISKTFFYPIDGNGAVLTKSDWSGNPKDIDVRVYQLIETRLLVKHAEGWDALPYIWSGGEAYLTVTGALKELSMPSGETINYLIPSKNQCAACHAINYTDKKILPIGPKARHLNRDDPIYQINQLQQWERAGKLTGVTSIKTTPNASLADLSSSMEHRVRSYLDINCGHCHNPYGAADTSGLLLDYKINYTPVEMGFCKPPIAAGSGSGGLFYSIVPGHAEQSILSYRLHSVKPDVMMPEIGRSLVHREGALLVDKWINSLSGECL